MKGKFIVIEGLDGSGLSTQSNLLVDYLNKKRKLAILTKEPTDSVIGGLIRTQLLGEWKTSSECLQLLFAADRAHHVEATIKPALAKGKWVVCDRYIFSSIAYGSVFLDQPWLEQINKQFLLPDLTICLKVPPAVCLERIKKKRFKLQLFENKYYLAEILRNFEGLAKKYKNFYFVDSNRQIPDVHADICAIVKKVLKR